VNRPLYEIAADLLALNDTLDDLEGDLSRAGELEAVLAAAIDGLAAEQAVKLDGYLNLIRQLRMEAVAAQAERDQYAKKAELRLKRAAALEDRLKEYLIATGQAKAQTASGRVVSVVVNGGALPLHLREGAAIPPEYHRVVREIDRTAIRDALTAGTVLDFAELLPRGTHLRVK
jgi:hypothetical protein